MPIQAGANLHVLNAGHVRLLIHNGGKEDKEEREKEKGCENLTGSEGVYSYCTEQLLGGDIYENVIKALLRTQ